MRLVGRALRRILRGVVIAVLEAAAIAREVVLIPIRLWMSAAEAAGRLVLGAWRLTWPVLERIWRAAAAAGRTAARLVTPARAVAVVVVAAALSLGASQLVHYRGVEVGAPPGAGITADAAVPQVDQL